MSPTLVFLVLIVLLAGLVVAIVASVKQTIDLKAKSASDAAAHALEMSDLQKRLLRYSAIQNLEVEQNSLQVAINRAAGDARVARDMESARRTKLDSEYQSALAEFERLRKEASLYEEKLNDISFGLYEPHFTFDSSEEYKTALTRKRTQVSAMIKSNEAATCATGWTVNGNAREGQRMVKQTMKVILRAFNSECEAALANVNYSNITKMEERVRKSREAVNSLGESMHIVITEKFLKLRLDELRLASEYEAKKYQEREEQRAAREQLRDEQKAQQEMEKAQKEAEIEEASYLKLLEKARKEAAEASGVQLQHLSEQVAGFEAKLDEARKKKERAISRAEQTKSGFVYVISNIGAFGPGVFKIGLTRRLEPLDRIAELSGASVPFPFDLHAMMFSMDAPALENALHSLFDSRKLNLVNGRKEFFQNVQLTEIEEFVRKQGFSAQFIELPEAREWRQTMAKRQQLEQQQATPSPETFAPTLFAQEDSENDSREPVTDRETLAVAGLGD